ncbi:hypothetical protein Purlil1_11681 [Purpureocillium lilacinum]|uniref:Endonuclease/exonuclease/phosphatase n=1 Tax=Purpureocillium lilacinum TaxID=33203 RepID=A0ABR0BIZ7_PURLI|nr:hypothetical protein Purlil1_11681 [Purpureocillium lilacinum]
MSNTLRVIQHNVAKQGPILESLMNDSEIENATVLAIQEPQTRIIKGRLLATPMGHSKWTKMVPATYAEGRRAIRSMLWARNDLDAEQLPTESPDMTAALLRLPDQKALRESCDTLRRVITETRRSAGRVVDVVIAGDFKRVAATPGSNPIGGTVQYQTDRPMAVVLEAMHALTLKEDETMPPCEALMDARFDTAARNTHVLEEPREASRRRRLISEHLERTA